jgi:hypothetical protein
MPIVAHPQGQEIPLRPQYALGVDSPPTSYHRRQKSFADHGVTL